MLIEADSLRVFPHWLVYLLTVNGSPGHPMTIYVNDKVSYNLDQVKNESFEQERGGKCLSIRKSTKIGNKLNIKAFKTVKHLLLNIKIKLNILSIFSYI